MISSSSFWSILNLRLIVEFQWFLIALSVLPLRSLLMRAHRLPKVYASVHDDRILFIWPTFLLLMNGFRWLCHLSLHCFPILPGRYFAMLLQFLGPNLSTIRMTISSSSLVQGPLTRLGFNTFCHLWRHCTSFRSLKNVEILLPIFGLKRKINFVLCLEKPYSVFLTSFTSSLSFSALFLIFNDFSKILLPSESRSSFWVRLGSPYWGFSQPCSPKVVPTCCYFCYVLQSLNLFQPWSFSEIMVFFLASKAIFSWPAWPSIFWSSDNTWGWRVFKGLGVLRILVVKAITFGSRRVGISLSGDQGDSRGWDWKCQQGKGSFAWGETNGRGECVPGGCF